MQQVTNLQELEMEINKNGEVVVSKNHNNNVIVMSIEEYKKKLLDDEIEKKLLRAEEQIEQGKTVKATEVFRSWKKNMDSKNELYEIEFTEDCRDEIQEIYKYISENLMAEEAAKNLMRKMRDSVMNLGETPEIYVKIEKRDRQKREFRRMVIDNYIILYTIDETKKTVYISHMYYGRRNYL